MNRARPTPPDGYYLRYGTWNGKTYDTVRLMAGWPGHPRQLDRRVAIIQENAPGEVYLAFLDYGAFGEPAMQHKDAQQLVLNVCAYDRLTSTTKG